MVNARSYYNDVYGLKDYYQVMKLQFLYSIVTLARYQIELNDDTFNISFMIFVCWIKIIKLCSSSPKIIHIMLRCIWAAMEQRGFREHINREPLHVLSNLTSSS